MSFLYVIFLKLLYPTSLCVILLLAAAALRKRRIARRVCFGLAGASLLVCGNGWLVGALTKHLEWKYLPPNPVPKADAILVLSGGIAAKAPPRPTVEIGEAGDRLLYGAYLFRQGRANHIICTGKAATGSIVRRPVADEMAEFLDLLGLPTNAVITEVKSENTYQHGVELSPVLKTRGFRRILLVTTAMHMPRSIGVFRQQCPAVEFIPAPTDFRITERIPAPWYRQLTNLIPTPSNLALFSEVMHEYLGIAYYRIRGWM